jgi:hypothetical protein
VIAIGIIAVVAITITWSILRIGALADLRIYGDDE